MRHLSTSFVFLVIASVYLGCAYSVPIAGSAGAGGAGGVGGATETSSSSVSSSGAASNKSIPCGASTCTGNEFCCLDLFLSSNSGCHASGSCTASLHVECDGPEDCSNGDICCALVTNQMPMTPPDEIKCSSKCDPPNRVMCGQMTGDSACPTSLSCQDDPAIMQSDYNVCRP